MASKSRDRQGVEEHPGREKKTTDFKDDRIDFQFLSCSPFVLFFADFSALPENDFLERNSDHRSNDSAGALLSLSTKFFVIVVPLW